jgi:transmembrane sensor
MTKDDFIKLYEKNLTGDCTPEEKKMLEEYDDGFSLKEVSWDEELLGPKEEIAEAMYVPIQAGMTAAGQARVRRIFRMRIRVAAAAILLPLVLGGVYLWSRHGPDTGNAVTSSLKDRFKNDVRPGGDKAILTLANGSSIALDSSGKGLLARQGNASVVKTNNGQLSYVVDRAVEAPVSYNTISTPRGGQYEVVLPDGSKAWLNAASSLRFPTAFTGRERRVELTGEGYFEIAKDASRPFKVAITGRAGAPEIEVLGTEFNVMAYADETSVNTTLVSGSVKLKNADQAWLLKPGQQARLKTDGAVNLDESADVDAATAWKNGRFELNGNIKDVMRQIARWYDVQVKYEGNVSDKALGGAISRKANVSEILKIFEMTGSIHFIIDGKTITVEPGPPERAPEGSDRIK